MNTNKKPARTPKSTPITDDYTISNTVLGLGINGKVVQCHSKTTGEKFALKVTVIQLKLRFIFIYFYVTRCLMIRQKLGEKLIYTGGQADVDISLILWMFMKIRTVEVNVF